jgi:hypothetical protein
MAKLINKDLYSSIIKDVISKRLTQKEAALKLEITDRQVRRIIIKYKDIGENAFIHKNIKNQNAKKIPDEISNGIVETYLNDFPDFGFTHFYEEQGYKYGISFSAMINIFIANDIISPYAQHKTVKLYNESMKKAIREDSITIEQEKLFELRKQEDFEKHIRKSTLHYAFGQEVQMDAAFWIWFGTEETALHLAVDKATKKVLFGWFDYEETTNAYMIVLMNMIINYGIPEKIKTDKRSSFSINNAKSSKSKLNVTQFKRICEDLEINLVCSSDPLFKPNAERENGTFKRRLTAELRHEEITSIEKANKYLNEIFIPKINKRFSYDINPNKCVMKQNNYTNEELDLIISIRHERTIDNASSIKYFTNYYLPIDKETGEVVSFKSGTKCIVINAYDNKLYASINDNIYSLYLVEQQEGNRKKTSKNGFKPSKDNPFTKFKIR